MAKRQTSANPPSTTPRSSASRATPTTGGTRAGRWRRCTSSIRCGSPTSATRPASASTATRRSSTASRACACSTSAAAAAFCRSRWRGSARTWSAPIRRRKTSRRRARMPRRAASAIDYRATTAEDLAAAGERFDVVLAMEVVEHVADVDAFVATCAAHGQAGRADDRRHAQSHAEELRAGHRRRRIRAALAAARHAPMGQVRHPAGAGRAPSSAAACASPASAASSTIPSPTAGSCRPTWT